MNVPQPFWIVRFMFSDYPIPAFYVFAKRKEAKVWLSETYPNLEADFKIQKVLIKRTK